MKRHYFQLGRPSLENNRRTLASRVAFFSIPRVLNYIGGRRATGPREDGNATASGSLGFHSPVSIYTLKWPGISVTALLMSIDKMSGFFFQPTKRIDGSMTGICSGPRSPGVGFRARRFFLVYARASCS
ncbi:hypothetical protein EVAR_21932_1 [Eumeta japonica]|uniref:Uncharacterized protein n=1 Tax=Eumeta variegata TaxID=151549 RepID=A0A4C1XHJ1_EUMVA|nr:hypothetical protein EVAR_21932_1 [Eumeta japonica]